ncbi:MAG TPA: DUF6175 family protein [Salinivirgaceae bacterium]|nr:DUF6175 family protein [Salinivirgaceae bacterium]
MKNLFTLIAILFVTTSLFGQAKKPTIMVVPSDQYCISRGYSMEFDNMGTKVILPDYKAALQSDTDLRLVISKMSGIMGDRGFPLKDLEQELKNLATQGAELAMLSSKTSGAGVAESPIDALKRTAKSDIIMDLSFEKKKQGPKNYITFILNGLDAYTSKNVASAAGTGQPSSAAQVEILLEEAVLAYMDEFNGRLMSFFEDAFANGREIKVRIQMFDGVGFDLEEEYDGSELSEKIEDWFAENTVQGRFSLQDATENFMQFEQVRIPMMNDKGRAVDARSWLRDLQKYLKEDPFTMESKLYMRGLGEAWLILGEK